ncbi:MAG: response regulator [Acidobacteriota bacterium]
MSSRRTILLVEDEELVRNYLKQLLTKNAWAATAVGSGDEALAQLAAFKFDIVLCDLDLGRGPNGIDLLRGMPSENEGTPFVILTAHGSIGRCRDAFLFGASDFLEKPLNRSALLSTLEQAISGSSEAWVEDPALATSDDAPHGLVDDAIGAAHVRRAIQIMEHRYAEFDLTVSMVAAEEGLSPDHLGRLFRERIGRSLLEHLHHIRTSRADELLATSRLSSYEIARACGYQRTSEFSSWFRRHRGAPPSGFRTPRSSKRG